MFDLIFWLVVIAYWVVAIKLLPAYYKRVDESLAKEFPLTYQDGMSKSTAWGAFALMAFWPYYEAGRWVQNTIIKQATKEQRKWDEYVKAEQIVKEYTERKEREDREAFDRALRGN
jgi:hypothetical protein